jgi:hypothetical protein
MDGLIRQATSDSAILSVIFNVLDTMGVVVI